MCHFVWCRGKDCMFCNTEKLKKFKLFLNGFQAHVCVEQTAMDLFSRGIRVHIVADATTSRSQENRMLAFEVAQA